MPMIRDSKATHNMLFYSAMTPRSHCKTEVTNAAFSLANPVLPVTATACISVMINFETDFTTNFKLVLFVIEYMKQS